MKIAERQQNKRITRDLLAVGRATHNALKCSCEPAERPEHCNVKYLLMQFCLGQGLDFWTEAEFENGSGRADFIISDWKLVVEVLHTEEEKRFLEKNYPLPTVAIKSTATPFDVKEMMDDLATCDGKNWLFFRRKYLKVSL